MISAEKVQLIQDELLAWYYRHRRDLPWRRSSDPYQIWVSEIMLQQTRVDTVIPYYNRFVEQFPTLERLAEAPEEQVIKAWEGLGYYSRVRNLHSAVKEVVESYGGVVPDEPEKISKLKGIGPYTAGAILSIAYNKKEPAIDGNVMRVFSRLFSIHDDIMLTTTRKKMEKLALEVIPEEAAGDFNQALMELGATTCLPTSAQCLFCPLHEVCEAYAQGTVNQLPVKKKAEKQVVQEMVFVWLTCEDNVLIEKRPPKGLLAGLSGFPTVEKKKGEAALQTFSRWVEEQQLVASNPIDIGEISHIFSHRHWKGTLIKAQGEQRREYGNAWEWVKVNDLFAKTFPVVYQKVIKKVLE